MNIARRMQYYHHYTRAELTAFVLDASKELLAEGQRITPINLAPKVSAAVVAASPDPQ